MKLNLGCGAKPIPGYVGIDIDVPENSRRIYDLSGAETHSHLKNLMPPDIIADLRDIPLDDEVADEILAIHVFEHFFVWEAIDVLKEWRRLLKPGGRLVMEMPDIVKAARNIIDQVINGEIALWQKTEEYEADQISMWGIYGDPRHRNPLMMHKWGWTFATLAPFLEARGFKECSGTDSIYHRIGKYKRDFRIDAVKA